MTPFGDRSTTPQDGTALLIHPFTLPFLARTPVLNVPLLCFISPLTLKPEITPSCGTNSQFVTYFLSPSAEANNPFLSVT